MWQKKCAMCQFVKEMDTLKTPDGKLVTVNQEITCQTKNVIYMASCSRCDKRNIYRRNRDYTVSENHEPPI